MSLKVQYEILSLNVDKLYPPYYTLKPGETLEEHMLDIEAFIYSCGWTPEQYLEEYIQRSLDELFPDPKKQN
jgi:hypothetical protein